MLDMDLLSKTGQQSLDKNNVLQTDIQREEERTIPLVEEEEAQAPSPFDTTSQPEAPVRTVEEEYPLIRPTDFVDDTGHYISIPGLSPLDPFFKSKYERHMRDRKYFPETFKQTLQWS